MKLTNDVVKKYVGGQLEIQNSVEKYVYKGEVETAEVKDGKMKIRFKWLAKMENGKWVAQDNLDYIIKLEFTSVSDIGDDLLHYEVMYVWESGTFFPPNSSKLDPNKVIGLPAQV